MTYPKSDITAAVAKGLAAAHDRPRTSDAGKSAAAYAGLGEHFHIGAWKHLNEDGDLPQASNKAWGMVAETVKAISAEHGGIIHKHLSLLLVSGELAELVRAAGDAQTADWIDNAFARARSLHANFYENEETPAQVAAGVRLSEQLSERLYALFWPEGRPA